MTHRHKSSADEIRRELQSITRDASELSDFEAADRVSRAAWRALARLAELERKLEDEQKPRGPIAA